MCIKEQFIALTDHFAIIVPVAINAPVKINAPNPINAPVPINLQVIIWLALEICARTRNLRSE